MTKTVLTIDYCKQMRQDCKLKKIYIYIYKLVVADSSHDASQISELPVGYVTKNT